MTDPNPIPLDPWDPATLWRYPTQTPTERSRSGSEVRKRSRQVAVRLTPDEYDWLAGQAKQRGVTMPALIRALLTAFTEATEKPDD